MGPSSRGPADNTGRPGDDRGRCHRPRYNARPLHGPHGGREECCCGQADRSVMSVITGKELPCPALPASARAGTRPPAGHRPRYDARPLHGPHGGREECCCGQADRPVMSVIAHKELPCPARQRPGRNATAGRTAAPRSQQPEAGITASRSGASPAQVYDGYMTGAWPVHERYMTISTRDPAPDRGYRETLRHYAATHGGAQIRAQHHRHRAVPVFHPSGGARPVTASTSAPMG